MVSYKYGGVQGNDVFNAINGDVIGVLVDFDKLQVTFYRNGDPLSLSGSLQPSIDYWPVIHLYYVCIFNYLFTKLG